MNCLNLNISLIIMHIVISGANGFIGSVLTQSLVNSGHTVASLKRVHSQTSDDEIVKQVQDADVIINLAGAPILGRWTEKYKKQILESRVVTTSALVRAVAMLDKKPELFISASAVGIYDTERENNEYNLCFANNFLATVCKSWEQAASPVAQHCRLAVFRIGVVIAAQNGALKRMLPIFRLGLGGTLAGGKQGFPWIHIDDVIHAVKHAISNTKVSGVYNLVAPDMVNNKEFTMGLAKILRRPAIFPIPAIVLRLLFGEAHITLTSGQFVKPTRLIESGFEFNYPSLHRALQQVVNDL